MQSFWIRVDRREDIASELERECESLEKSVADLRFVYIGDEDAPDEGRFRDFAAFARAEHPDAAVLEWVAEELVDLFGWRVDVGAEP